MYPMLQTQASVNPVITPVMSGVLQRACACGQHTSGSDECKECKQKRQDMLQRSATNAAPVSEVPPIVHKVLRSPGQPLDAQTLAFMEPRFGHDFSGVRVHTDAKAAESARDVNALAYTVGRDVVFGAGQHSPRTSAGRRLMAHELTHVVQQTNANAALQGKLTVGATDDSYEREANNIAETVNSGDGHASSASPTLQSKASLQRACGPAALGAPAGCTPVSGDIVGERFLFAVNCDDFLQPTEQARLEMFADTIANGESVEIHGYASTDGDPTFNENLSCARALKAQTVIQSILTGKGVAAAISVFMHGANPGLSAAEQRSVVISRSGVVPPLPAGSCKIDVRATHIGGILSGAPIWHLFIVYTDDTGTEHFFRGGPGGRCSGVAAGSHGTIISTSGRYVAGTIDWDPGAPSVTVLSGAGACGKDVCFASELSRIDGRCVPYQPTGPNSNTVAKTLLSKCNVPRVKPVSIAPGWGDPDL